MNIKRVWKLARGILVPEYSFADGADAGIYVDNSSSGPSVVVTWNPSDINADLTLSNGNLTVERAANYGNYRGVRATFGISTGKWYWLIKCDVNGTFNNTPIIGAAALSYNLTTTLGGAGSISYNTSGAFSVNGTNIGTGTAWTTGNHIGFAVDMDNKTVAVYVNGGLSISGSWVTDGLTLYPCAVLFSGPPTAPADKLTANFGNTSFAHAAPSGYLPIGL